MGQSNNTTKEKKWKQITEEERYKIEGWLQARQKHGEIALMLKKHVRTVKREIAMGLVVQRDSELREKEVYKADYAQMLHDEKASHKGRNHKIGKDHALAEHIEKKIGEEKYSPDAVIGEIKAKCLKFGVTLCTKTVYNMIDSGFFLNITNKDLPVKKAGVKRKYKKIRKVALNNKNGKSISKRPKEADERTEQGHWEIDLVVGKQGTKPVILTLVERKTRKSLYVLVKNKQQKEVIEAIKKVKQRAGGNFEDVFKSITADNGSEFLDSESIKKAAKCNEVYYAHPYSSWERGSNENGNRILRRFIPKGSDIGKFTDADLQRIEDWVNNYPRRIFDYKSANDMYNGVA